MGSYLMPQQTHRGHREQRMKSWFEQACSTRLLGTVATCYPQMTWNKSTALGPSPITVPPLGCFMGVRGAWWLTCAHVCLPFSQLALDYGIKFMETSAKANINVENVSPRPTAPAPSASGSGYTLQRGSATGTGHRFWAALLPFVQFVQGALLGHGRV